MSGMSGGSRLKRDGIPQMNDFPQKKKKKIKNKSFIHQGDELKQLSFLF